MFKVFRVTTKNGRKSWFPKSIGYFQMHTSFKFYFSNHCSNEKVSNTKVVDLEILSKFGIQKFFVWGQEDGEKLSLQTGIFELQFNYQIALTPSLSLSPPSLFSPRRRLHAGAGQVAGHAPRPHPKLPSRPLPGTAQACHAPSTPSCSTRRGRRHRSRRQSNTCCHATTLAAVPVISRSELRFSPALM